MSSEDQHRGLVHLIIFSLAVFLLFKIVEPLMTIFLSSIIITYVFFPLYKVLKKRVRNEFFSIILVILIIAVVILLPFSYLIFEVSNQSSYLYGSLSGNIAEGTLFGFSCKVADSKFCLFINSAERFSVEELSKWGLDKHLQNFLLSLVGVVTGYLVKIPQVIVGIVLSLFISYFLFRDGEKIVKHIANWIPFRKKTVNKLIGQFKRITYTIVFAQLFVALAQGFVGVVGFYIFGVPLPIFWGIVMAFFALIPTVGTAFVWFPASLFLVLSGYLTQDYLVLAKGVGLFVYGILVISTIDNILRIKLIQAKAEVHPIIVIMGVIGGVNLFGFAGLFLGPIILSMLLTYLGSFDEKFI